MRLHCDIYGQWKHTLTCAMSCPHTYRCKQFAEFRRDTDNEETLQESIRNHIKAYPNNPYHVLLIPVSTKAREKKVKRYACIREEKVVIITEAEITERVLGGERFDDIFEVGRQMEIQIRLVPTKKSDVKKAKKAAAAEAVAEEVEEVEEDEGEEEEKPKSRSRKKK